MRQQGSTRRRSTCAAGTLLAIGLLSACTAATSQPDQLPEPSAAPTTMTTPAVAPDLDLAISTPVEDSVYPEAGDPRVDVLLYDLDLTWQPTERLLSGNASVTFRAARTARRFQLDLARPMKVTGLTLDGEPVDFTHPGKLLVVDAPVTLDQRYEVAVTYAGKPGPVPAPTTRSDFSTTGLTVTDAGEVWTMQEPFGAYTWYPVNDQPSDKALYDITVHAPSPWTGISNGHLVELTRNEEGTTTSWQLTEPASSYLITLAIGDYAHSSNTTGSGLRVDYWTPRGMVHGVGRIRSAAAAIDWIEGKLGPYPFSSLGLVVTDSVSAMETQTMVTLGNTDYVLSPQVITHELVHQWYGDQVSPADWRDVWLNEGMTMLLQWIYEDEHDIAPLRATLAGARAADQSLRDSYGPPGDYDARQFGSSNIYYLPALMWNELRTALGDDEFYRIARSWLTEQDNTAATREQIFAHWEKESGRELSAFFDGWITGSATPRPGVPRP